MMMFLIFASKEDLTCSFPSPTKPPEIGKQIVQSVVKQEELKLLKTRDGAKEAMKQDSTISDLPDLVRDALLGM